MMMMLINGRTKKYDKDMGVFREGVGLHFQTSQINSLKKSKV